MLEDMKSTYNIEEDDSINKFQVEKLRPIYKVSPYRIVYYTMVLILCKKKKASP